MRSWWGFVVVVACSRPLVPFRPTQTDCTPGDTRACTCSTGAEGTQMCLQLEGGAGFGACDCVKTLGVPSALTVKAGVVFRIDVKLQDLAMLQVSETLATPVTIAHAQLKGTLSKTPQAGAASFDDLHIDVVGAYALVVTYPGLGTSTVNVTVTPGPIAKLMLAPDLPATWEQGAAFQPAAGIDAFDAVGNLVTDSVAVIEAELLNPPAGLALSQARQATLAGGHATFDRLAVFATNSAVGNVQVRFFVQGTPTVNVVSRSVAVGLPDIEYPRYPIGSASMTNLDADVAVDNTTGILWRRDVISGSLAEVIVGCSGLTSSIDGHTYKSRLPSRIEMLTRDDVSGEYWTASPGDYTVINGTLSRVAPTGNTYDALCVVRTAAPRPAPSDVTLAPAGQYTVVGTNSQGLRDNRTQLTWQTQLRNAMSAHVTAVANCASQLDGGFNDWRLPEMHELASIVNLRNQGSVLVAKSFSDFAAQNVEDGYWSNTIGPSGDPLVVDFGSGRIYEFAESQQFAVRCVRP